MLSFADAVHLGSAFGADPLGCGLAVLHFDGFGILHFFLGPAFHAICFH